jgi:hypothetical protein
VSALRRLALAAAVLAGAASDADAVARAGGGRMATASVSAANAALGSRPVRPPGADGDRVRWVGTAYGYYWYEDASWQEEAAQREEAPAPPPQPAVPPPPPPAVGTTHMSLPAGCSTVERSGRFLRSCNGVFYEESFAGDRVVYTVVQ